MIVYQQRRGFYHLTLTYKHVALWRCIIHVSKCISCKKRLLRRRIHHLQSDLINNMGHMRISGTEPSLVMLSQTKYTSQDF